MRIKLKYFKIDKGYLKSLLKNILPVLVLCFIAVMMANFLGTGWLNNLSPQTVKYRELYKQAKKLQDNGDYKTAFATYSKISKGYAAFDIVLFQEAKCAAAIEDEKTAIEKLRLLLRKFSNSPIADQASYALGQAYMRTGDHKAARKQFFLTIKNYPGTNYAIGSYYYLGQILKNKNKILAANYWLKYLALAPDGRFAIDCIDGVKSTATKLTPIENKSIGVALYLAQRYRESLKYLNQAPIQSSWYYLAKNYEMLGNNNLALNLFKEGISKYQDAVKPKEMQDAMRSYVKLSPKPATESWSELINISDLGRDYALFNKARLAPSNLAHKLYREIISEYPKSDFASESLWNLFWNAYNGNSYYAAIQLGMKHISMFVNTKASPKILFWTGKAFEKVGKTSRAAGYYKKLLSTYPDSYYAFRAAGRLEAVGSGEDPGWATNEKISVENLNVKPVMPYSYNEISKNHGKLVAELVMIGDHETLNGLIKDDPFLESWVKLEEGIVSKSIVLARDGMNSLMPKPGPKDKRWRLIYPLYFIDYINHYAKNNKLDPVIVLSLIKEESYFNPLAVSSSNARGLMQLLPGTARDIARWRSYQPPSDFQLFSPKINIELGTAYLRHAKERLSNQIVFAVAGYNGGPGAVENWLRKNPSTDMDQFIENIPYDQTRDYIKKVYGSYWNYKRIYNID